MKCQSSRSRPIQAELLAEIARKDFRSECAIPRIFLLVPFKQTKLGKTTQSFRSEAFSGTKNRILAVQNSKDPPRAARSRASHNAVVNIIVNNYSYSPNFAWRTREKILYYLFRNKILYTFRFRLVFSFFFFREFMRL